MHKYVINKFIYWFMFNIHIIAVYDCGILNPPQYGMIDFIETTFGSIATYSCNVGFNLTGNSGKDYRVCIVDGWTGAEPSCEGI